MPPSQYAEVYSYQVVYNTSVNSTETLINTESTRTSYIFTNVNRGHTYFMRVRAMNMWGPGPYSTQVKSERTDGSGKGREGIIEGGGERGEGAW